ncbi:hypothetical protein [Helicobacter cappadocius]|uniref:Flp pilus assembly protein RcpC/CpaB domain-containing protein n=1 Tax=Helicobacter cappadocius TaxID=3063998 RepID=A0AA90T4U9_9HELI|nr:MULTISPECIES: hypothetical protein [unclassified Helicobacter]MDO7253126.1 hypothetical protein [Helicobacter sp. faydin-H75]MDP2538748.1 hypothetical protein [Helicobacter sp. faydin-H76]
MNKKIIIIISIIILLVSILGLLTSQEDTSNKVPQTSPTPKKITYSFLVTTRDLHSGEIINFSDIATEYKEDEENKDWGNILVNKTKDFITNSIALKNIKKGEFILESDITRPGTQRYNELKIDARDGLFSFGFDLTKREYSILSKLKPGQLVDVYFKYETKNKKTIPVLPKRNQNQQYLGDGNASSTNLILLFSNKKVLFLEKIPAQEEQTLPSKPIAQLHVELSEEEIKKIYAIEDLGIFIIFPTNKKQQNNIATENILTKDFIKELRGGADGKNDSY